MKTLIVGGYGNFGARIARALARHDGIELLIAGRDAARAAALAASLGPDARAHALDVNDESQLAAALRGIGLLIHTAGPFQTQGYGVARAGVHYIDLADGRRFVCDFAAALDDAFRSANRCAITGASTVPALSSAVVDHLAHGWRALDEIDL
ncbi:MAG: saccharopine dehydrogenase NADP-binding domain-containing protein, partial [Burkholderiaceae bacterium]|nr:saccharopine dehydrogenase NADP-binding domain-containing protein [Burkholderiaceae bacterium]